MHYVMSDIHNNKQKFCDMLNQIHFSEDDHLYILGDLFDGTNCNPNPVDLYFEILKLGNHCSVVRGNHDQWLATYVKNYYEIPEHKQNQAEPYYYNTFELLQRRLTVMDIQNLAKHIMSWPLQITDTVGGGRYLFAHAITSTPLSVQNDEYYLTGILHNENFLRDGIEGYISVCGHTGTADGRIWHNQRENVYMIDCGCGFQDGRLGCLCLESKEEFYI